MALIAFVPLLYLWQVKMCDKVTCVVLVIG